jgi:hypothetical protein
MKTISASSARNKQPLAAGLSTLFRPPIRKEMTRAPRQKRVRGVSRPRIHAWACGLYGVPDQRADSGRNSGGAMPVIFLRKPRAARLSTAPWAAQNLFFQRNFRGLGQHGAIRPAGAPPEVFTLDLPCGRILKRAHARCQRGWRPQFDTRSARASPPLPTSADSAPATVARSAGSGEEFLGRLRPQADDPIHLFLVSSRGPKVFDGQLRAPSSV